MIRRAPQHLDDGPFRPISHSSFVHVVVACWADPSPLRPISHSFVYVVVAFWADPSSPPFLAAVVCLRRPAPTAASLAVSGGRLCRASALIPARVLALIPARASVHPAAASAHPRRRLVHSNVATTCLCIARRCLASLSRSHPSLPPPAHAQSIVAAPPPPPTASTAPNAAPSPPSALRTPPHSRSLPIALLASAAESMPERRPANRSPRSEAHSLGLHDTEGGGRRVCVLRRQVWRLFI